MKVRDRPRKKAELRRKLRNAGADAVREQQPVRVFTLASGFKNILGARGKTHVELDLDTSKTHAESFGLDRPEVDKEITLPQMSKMKQKPKRRDKTTKGQPRKRPRRRQYL